jgi:hypothetical protein
MPSTEKLHFQAGGGGGGGDAPAQTADHDTFGAGEASEHGEELSRKGGGDPITKAVSGMEHLLPRDRLGKAGETPVLTKSSLRDDTVFGMAGTESGTRSSKRTPHL